jgi:hypothetical protein
MEAVRIRPLGRGDTSSRRLPASTDLRVSGGAAAGVLAVAAILAGCRDVEPAMRPIEPAMRETPPANGLERFLRRRWTGAHPSSDTVGDAAR